MFDLVQHVREAARQHPPGGDHLVVVEALQAEGGEADRDAERGQTRDHPEHGRAPIGGTRKVRFPPGADLGARHWSRSMGTHRVKIYPSDEPKLNGA